jgi:hypothetical protein
MGLPSLKTDIYWYRLQAPGSRFGACLTACEHLDCLLLRNAAELPCNICLLPLGYDREIRSERKISVHRSCYFRQQGNAKLTVQPTA